MKADITFHVEFAESTKFKITCGSVDGDGIPVPLYMGLLSALVEFQDRINGDDKPYVYRPVLGRQGSKPVTDNDVPKYTFIDHGLSTPPTTPKTVVSTKMRKAYTEDEKTEIAQLYRDGRPVNEIASKFGRKPDSIYKLLSSMGVKRRKYEKPEVIAGSDASDPPKAKRECTLKKPWYLQRQTPKNRDKANHE